MSYEYKIEDGIKIPPRGRTAPKRKEPWVQEIPLRQLKVRQSVLVPHERIRSNEVSLRVSIAYYGKQWGRSFVCRSGPDGLRIWRVK